MRGPKTFVTSQQAASWEESPAYDPPNHREELLAAWAKSLWLPVPGRTAGHHESEQEHQNDPRLAHFPMMKRCRS